MFGERDNNELGAGCWLALTHAVCGLLCSDTKSAAAGLYGEVKGKHKPNARESGLFEAN